MSDIEITCQDCQTPFAFTESEQSFYQEKGFSNPKRCKACRQARKEQGGGGGGGRSSASGERPAYNGGGRGRDSGDREFHDAVCSDCGIKTQVPFKPNGNKPVYCRDCFKAQRR